MIGSDELFQVVSIQADVLTVNIIIISGWKSPNTVTGCWKPLKPRSGSITKTKVAAAVMTVATQKGDVMPSTISLLGTPLMMTSPIALPGPRKDRWTKRTKTRMLLGMYILLSRSFRTSTLTTIYLMLKLAGEEFYLHGLPMEVRFMADVESHFVLFYFYLSFMD